MVTAQKNGGGEYRVYNLTGKHIALRCGIEIPPDDMKVSIGVGMGIIGGWPSAEGIFTYSTDYADDLPDEEDGTLYIVPLEFKLAVRERHDLLHLDGNALVL